MLSEIAPAAPMFVLCSDTGLVACCGVVRLGRVGAARSLADMLFDPPVDLRGDRADDHATTATLEDALMRPGGQRPVRIGLQFDDRELQRLRGGLDGLLVFGPEPGGLGQRGAAGRAVDEDRGHGVRFCLGC